MEPEVHRITSLDIYRDGGSLSASFCDSEGIEYELMFPIRLLVDESRFASSGYREPVIRYGISSERVSAVTGKVSVDWKWDTIPSSWPQARAILKLLEPQVGGFETPYAYVFALMVDAAAVDGRHID